MSNSFYNLSSGSFTQNWSNTGLITTDNNWNGVPSIVGFSTGDVTSATGVDPQTILSDSGFSTRVIANQAATATSGAVIDVDSGIANPTIAFQGSNGSDYHALVFYMNAAGRQNVTFNANIRDLDASADNATQQVALQYRIGDTGTWINLPAGFIADATTASSATQVTPISVVLPVAANDAANLEIRIVTTNAAGNDELIGVDDIVISSSPMGNSPGAFSVSDPSVLEGDAGTVNLVYTVTRSGGSTGAVSVDFATADGTAAAGSDYAANSGTLNFADGETSKTIIVTVNGDTDTESSETILINLANATGGATIADAQGVGTITNDDISVSKIHDIQGPAFFSPVLAAEGITAFNVASAATVTVTGVVTAIDSYLGSGVQGFYISEEVADWDNNALTSEGIFVRTSGSTAGLAVGETVTVTAHVMEYQDFTNLNRTMLVNATSITQFNDSVALPTFVIDGSAGHKIPTSIISDDSPVFTDATGASGTFDPQNDALDFYETVEGMLVKMTNMVVADGFVGGSNDDFIYFNAYSADNADAALINSRGGYTITGDPQRYPIDTADTADDVKFGGATVHDGAQHGDIIEVDFGNVGIGGASSFDQDLTMGDSLGDVTGIIDFDFGVTKLYVTQALDPSKVAALDETTPGQEVTTLSGDDARALRVATFNVENLSPVGTTFSTNNGVEITTADKYTKLAAHIATNLDAPDILIIEEVQDNNGVTADSVTDASTTWGQLVAAVNAATGKHYQWVDEAPQVSGTVGGAPGGNIRVGFLYDTDRVQLGDLDADASLAERRQFTDRIGDGVRDAGDLIGVDDSGLGINPNDWNGTRRSIVGEFNFHGQSVYVFGSHLPSKGGSGDPYIISQNGSSPANGDWALRSTLAQDVWQVMDKVSSNLGDKVVSGGDFNEFWFNRPLEVLTGYANPDGSGNTTGADYVNLMVDKLAPVDRFSYDFDGRSEALDTIVSDQALAGVAAYDVVHINTGYNERSGATNPASSDHDPSLASFDFRSFAETLSGAGGDDVIQGFGGDDTIAGNAGNDTAVFASTWLAATVTAGGTVVATPAEGTDTLASVETLRFAGVDVAAADAVNDAPLGTDDNVGGLAEDGNSAASGNVLANDSDADLALGLGETLSVIGARLGAEAASGSFTAVAGTPLVLAGLYGSLSIAADGSYAYSLDQGNAAVQALSAGQHASDAFTYQVSDAHGLTDTAQMTFDITGASDGFTLQLLHFSDAEAGALAPQTAPLLAALVDAFEDDFANSITLASGDLFLPGPFLAAGTDLSVKPVLNAVSGSSISLDAGVNLPIAAVDVQIMNQIGVQLSTIGNHEFDLGSRVLRDAISPNLGASGYVGANYVYLSANLDFSGDADLNPRFTQTVGTGTLTNEEASDLKGRIAPSAVIYEGGEPIGFVGATTQVLEQISSPTGTEVKGFPTGLGPNGEINDMVLLAAQLQPVIDDLIAQGVNKIVLVSHLQDYHFEEQLAPLLHGVDIIISGGSHARFGDENDTAAVFPGHSPDFAETYPIVTSNADGKTTLIVNTDGEYTYLGRLVVDFDNDGDIVLSGNTTNSTVNGAYASTAENVAEAWGTTVDNLDNTAFADGTRGEQVKDLTDAVDAVIEAKDSNIFGYTNVYLEGERQQVRTQETNLGDLSADANAAAARTALGLSSDEAIVSIKNGGGIRAQIGTIENAPDGVSVIKLPPEVDGEVSQLDVENSLRFDNKLMVYDTTAQGLLNILNSPNTLAPNNGGFIQIGGVRFSYDPTKPAGSRVQDVVLVNEAGYITAVIADNGVVNPNAPALIHGIVLNFTANGGDGYLFKQNAENFRYVKTDGTLSAVVPEGLDFTAATTINTYAGATTNLLGEQKAFADYMTARYGTPETAFDQADTGQALDIRIQNQAARTDTVLQGDYLLLGTAGSNTINGTAGAETIKGLAGDDKLLGNGGDDVLIGGLGRDTINGGDGNDTASYAGAASGIVADLSTSKGSYGEAIGDKFVSIENLTGSSFDDALFGNRFDNILNGGDGNDTLEGIGGNDTLIGGKGDDVLNGGKNVDTMTGGEGSDIFYFASGDSGKTIDKADTILDFLLGVDKIDMSGVDAITKTKDVVDAFTFIGTSAFHKVAGELRYEVIGTDAYVAGDMNGDGKGDIMIHLANVSSLSAGDFLFA